MFRRASTMWTSAKNLPVVPQNFSKAHSRTMESSSRLRPSRQRASGASCSTLRAHPPCAAAVRLFRRGRRKKGEKRRDFETRSLGDRTGHVRESRYTALARYVTSRRVTFTRVYSQHGGREYGYGRRARYRRDDSSGLASCHSSSDPERCARRLCHAICRRLRGNN